MKKLFVQCFVIGLFFPALVGCVQSRTPLYVWGNYVKSSTEYGMNGHKQDVRDKHLAELKSIIEASEAEQKRVAPGIYAEYAQLLFETNRKQDAKRYFALEKNTYPESTQFINRVTLKLYGEEL